MHLMRSIVLVPVLAFAAATTVFAQTGAQGREAVPEDYGYLIGHGGVTAAPAGAEFAVEYRRAHHSERAGVHHALIFRELDGPDPAR